MNIGLSEFLINFLSLILALAPLVIVVLSVAFIFRRISSLEARVAKLENTKGKES